MSKIAVTAEYDTETKTLTLNERLAGVWDDEVKVKMPPPQRLEDREERIARLRAIEGSLSGEAGESFAKAVAEMFPPWNDPNEL